MKATLQLLIVSVLSIGISAHAAPSITVMLSGNTLVLTSTSIGKAVQLSQNGSGDWVVKGLFGTRVNGNLSGQTFASVSNIVLDLGSGSDVVKFLGGSVAGAVTVSYINRTGIKQLTFANLNAFSITYDYNQSGLNVISYSDTSAANGITTVTGNGGSVVKMNNTDAGNGSLVTVIGNGNSHVTYSNSGAQNGSVVLVTGNGSSDISLTDSGSVSSSMTIVTGSGKGNVNLKNCSAGSSAVVVTSDGWDNIGLNGFACNDLTVVSGGGRDAIIVNNATVVNNLTINGGPGFGDVIGVQNSSAATALFSESNGHGVLGLSNNSFGSVTVDPRLVRF